jgi:hypothetical protein
MTRRSAYAARIFGAILIALICAWDMDAMRPHIAAHSWGTLALVALFLIVHLTDYLTVGRIVNRLDPLVLEALDRPSSLILSQPTAKLYTFTAVTTTAEAVSGAPYPVTHRHFIVEPE